MVRHAERSVDVARLRIQREIEPICPNQCGAIRPTRSPTTITRIGSNPMMIASLLNRLFTAGGQQSVGAGCRSGLVIKQLFEPSLVMVQEILCHREVLCILESDLRNA
jgi:hypothetical protein